MMPHAVNSRKLPLHEEHARRGAKFGTFGDWEVPLYYSSILEEHRAVRERAGVFDISHMGEILIEGPGAARILDGILPRPIAPMEKGRALYMPLLHESGGIVDDVILYRFDEDRFLFVVNAGNIAKDDAWLRSRIGDRLAVENQSEEKGLLALQGPLSESILKAAVKESWPAELGYYRFRPWKSGMIARTGYTGEDGFEIMADKADLVRVWTDLFQAAASLHINLVPVGFGCRDTLRLEAGMPLYGHDLSDETTPLEARLGWAVDLSKTAFYGKASLDAQKADGVCRKLVGFEMIDRGIPREGYPVHKSGKAVGRVTSGTMAPTLNKNIGMAYVAADEAREGNELSVLVRGRETRMKVVRLPFYKRKS